MRYCVIGDLHLDSKIGNKDVLFYFDKIKDEIIKISNNCDKTILLGDYFNNSNPSNVYREKFAYFISNLKNVYLLLGNHDIDINGHVLQSFKPFKFRIIENNMIEKDTDGIVGFLSYNRNYKEMENFLLTNKHCKYIFAHCDVNGYILNKNFESKINIKVNTYKLYLGHIHKRQIIDKNIIYIGSVLPCDLGEINYKTGILIIDDDKEKWIDFDLGFKIITISNEKDFENKKNQIDENTYLIIKLDTIEKKVFYLSNISNYLAINFVIDTTINKKQIDFNLKFEDIVLEYLKMIKKEYLKEKVFKYLKG